MQRTPKAIKSLVQWINNPTYWNARELQDLSNLGAPGGFRDAVSPECEKNQIVELKRIWELVVRYIQGLKRAQLRMVRLSCDTWVLDDSEPSKITIKLLLCFNLYYNKIISVFYVTKMWLFNVIQFSYLRTTKNASHRRSLLIVRWNIEFNFSLLWLNRAERIHEILATGWLFSRILGMACVSACVSR